MPFSFRVLFDEGQIGAPIVEPAEVTRRLLTESGPVAAGTPLMWVRMGDKEYELRVLFPCYIGVRVNVSNILKLGDLLAAGGADGEDLPDGFRYLGARELTSSAGEGSSR